MAVRRPHVVFMNLPATGHVNPTLPLVTELRQSGCEVSYFIPEKMRESVEAVGATWRPFADATSPEVHAAALAKYEAAASENSPMLQVSMLAVTHHILPGLLADLRALEPQPTVIIYDPFLPCGRVTSHVLGIPCISFVSFPGPGVLQTPDAIFHGWESSVVVQESRKTILANYGIDVLESSRPMEYYSPIQNIVTTIEDLYVPPSSLMQKERFGHFPFTCVGALIDTKAQRIANVNVTNAPASLPMERVQMALSTGVRLLYVSLGTVASSKYWANKFGPMAQANGLEECTGKEITQHVFRACFDAFSDHDDILVIVSIGPQEDVLHGLPTTPANFILRESVPQLEVLSLCHAFVTHGGANSVHEALNFGVPLAVVPLFGDQPVNADSVVAVGAGVGFRDPLHTLTAPALRDAVTGLIDVSDSNTYRAGARNVMKKMKYAGGLRKAADVVLELSSNTSALQGGA